MNEAVRAACHPNTTIAAVLSATPTQAPQPINNTNNQPTQQQQPTGAPILLSTPTILNSNADAQLYFSALLANQPAIASPRGVLGLLLLPTGELTKHVSSFDFLLHVSNSQCIFGVTGDGLMGLPMPDAAPTSTGGDASATDDAAVVATDNTTNNAATAIPQPPAISDVAAESAAMYLRAVSKHCGTILEAWNKGSLTTRHVESIAKATSASAYLCSKTQPSIISTSGILMALAQLATGYKDTQQPRTTSTGSEYMYRTLTPIHTEFLQCCILAHHYRLAAAFCHENEIHSVAYPLSKEIISQVQVDGKDKKGGAGRIMGPLGHMKQAMHHSKSNFNTKGSKKHPKSLVSVESFLRYYYNLGLVYMGLEKYSEAISAFKICMTIPSSIPSAISIAARKKMLLASCLLLEWNDEEDLLVKSSNQKNRLNTFSSAESLSKSSSSSTSKNTNGGEATMDQKIIQQLLELPNGTSYTVIKYITEASSASRKLKRKALAGTGTGSGAAVDAMDMEDIPSINEMEPNSGMVDDITTPAVHHSSGSGYGSQHVERMYKKNHFGLACYDELVSHFIKCDVKAFTASVSSNESIFSFDGNIDLVNKLKGVMDHRSVRNISRIYSTISVSKFVDLLGLRPNTETISKEEEIAMTQSILSAIAFRQACYNSSSTNICHVPIPFSIDVENAIVYFDDSDDSNDDASGEKASDGADKVHAQEELSKRIEQCMDLAKRVTELDIAAATSEKYVVHSVKKETNDAKNSTSSSGGAATAPGGQSVADLIGDDATMESMT